MKKSSIPALTLAAALTGLVACGQADADGNPTVYVEAELGQTQVPLTITFHPRTSARLIDRLPANVRIYTKDLVPEPEVADWPFEVAPTATIEGGARGELVVAVPVSALDGIGGLEDYLKREEGKILILNKRGDFVVPN